ncbi:SpoIIE family protein phosphatase [Chitinimonas sp.]|uniref:SpoIIE family protein phosphatase n=1 Tax=Chitinimonas sp. TaxID=1934313 RepID=UPI0035B3309B
MKILLADDAEVVRQLIGRFVESLGHQLILAKDGAEAVEKCLSERPDMVLMDMLMPHLDGGEAARQIKQRLAGMWIPVVLVTAVEEVGRLADAMESGADDYLLKPVNYRILEAKIKAIGRTVELNRKVREQASALAEYFDRSEEEKRVAQYLMDQLVNRERLSDPQLHCWISPAASLSGDLIAAARTPGNILHLVLADGIGHGLTAALNVLPLTQPFYAMTERGFAMRDILIEMHRKVRQVLPVDRFVALAFVAVDFSSRQIAVWNGGIPEVRFYDEKGRLSKRWQSRHLPLGIVPQSELDLTVEHYAYESGGNLVMCSDGLLEARNAAGESFGLARLALATAGVTATDARARTIARLSEFLGGAVCHDDVSLAIVDIDAGSRLPLPDSRRVVCMPLDADAQLDWRYAISLGASELRRLQTIPMVMSFVSQLEPLREANADIFLILTELFVNALDHGLLKLSPEAKSAFDGLDQYLDARLVALAELQTGRIDIELESYSRDGHSILRMRVTDSGDGFDFSPYLATQPDSLSRKGIAMVKARASSLAFSGKGNIAEACYAIKK